MTTFADTYVVVASPSDDTETIIASVVVPAPILATDQVSLHAWARLIADGDATAAVMRIRRTDIDGVIVYADSANGGLIGNATGAYYLDAWTEDGPGLVGAATYVFTVTMTGATGPSTIGAVALQARY